VGGISDEGLAELHARLRVHVEGGDVPGLVALIARGDDVHVEVLGSPALGDPAPLGRDAIFRIASISKPIGAAGAMVLVDNGVLSLDDPVEKFLPELADRHVLRSLEGPLDDTVAAERSITVEDLLTFRFGFGVVLAAPGSYPIQMAEQRLGLTSIGEPWPPTPFDSDEWIARFATLPLMDQPGAAWRYNTGAQVLGILIERAAGRPLEAFLRENVFEPLGMRDTSFSVPQDKMSWFTTAYAPSPSSGQLNVLDRPATGWWSAPPAMANVAGMLVSTIDDLWAFVSMLAAGGRHGDRQLLSPEAVEAMTTNHLSEAQRAENGLFLGAGGWGYCMAASVPLEGELPVPWGYGWDGGTGTTWRTDPVRGLTGILLTQRAMTSPEPPPLFADFWAGAMAAIT
jgi:CubicO group peptidase (beta-lactamase class C family)